MKPVDRTARAALVQILTSFGLGRLSVDECRKRAPTTDDPAIAEILHEGLDTIVDLASPEGPSSHAASADHPTSGLLDETQKKELARYLLFLRSELPYRWPRQTGVDGLVNRALVLVSLGLLRRRLRKSWLAKGNYRVWPFHSSYELEHALSVLRAERAAEPPRG